MLKKNDTQTHRQTDTQPSTKSATEITETPRRCLKVFVIVSMSEMYREFVISRFFMKLFTTKSIETVKYCQEHFGFSLPSVLWAKRVSTFEFRFEGFLSVL